MKLLVLDANMIVVFVVGSVAPALLGVAKRVKEYQPDDFDVLTRYLHLFTEIVMLPNTLTEASNLLAQIKGAARDECLIFLAGLAQGNEQYIRSAVASACPDFLNLGLTDAAIICSLGSDTYLLTADYDLYVTATRRAHRAEYFRHLCESA